MGARLLIFSIRQARSYPRRGAAETQRPASADFAPRTDSAMFSVFSMSSLCWLNFIETVFDTPRTLATSLAGARSWNARD